MSNRAWVTLATNDSYGLGALVLANSLRRAGSVYPAVVLITPSVTDPMRERLNTVFSEVVTVDVLDSRDTAHLALLQRPELGITFTKLHCWSLTQYDKCVFLDADTLIVQNCDELFEREELSAAPDVGWPDCFNSGVFVFVPSQDTYTRLITFAQERGSFDGGDQGVLNAFFSDWARGDINKHLPFLYNVTSAAFYSYIPALKQYGENLKIIHFIGTAKPWLQQYNWQSRSVDAPTHLQGFLQLWWDIFVGQVHTQLDTAMEPKSSIEEEGSEPPEELILEPPQDNFCYYAPTLDVESEFPWHHPQAQVPEAEAQEQQINMSDIYDPWKYYRGNIPPWNADPSSQEPENYVWDYLKERETKGSWQQPYHEYGYHENRPQEQKHQQHSYHDHSEHHREHNTHHHDSHHHDHHPEHNTHHHTHSPSSLTHQHPTHGSFHHHHHAHSDHHLGSQHENHSQKSDHSFDHSPSFPSHKEGSRVNEQAQNFQHDPQSHSGHHSHHHESQNDPHSAPYQSHLKAIEDHPNKPERNESHDHGHPYPEAHIVTGDSHKHSEHRSHLQDHGNYSRQTQQRHKTEVYRIHLDLKKERRRQRLTRIRAHAITCTAGMNGHVNGHSGSDSEDDDFIPRHPYDGFYLRHIATIDSRGHKICSHEIPPTPIPSPPVSRPSSPEENSSQSPDEYDTASECDDDVQTGVAGNLARVVPGAVEYQREAIDELNRRQGWEAGNIDYMGADSFANIWAKISQTLNQAPKQPSPPKKEPTPPKEPEVPQESPAAAATEAPTAVSEAPAPEASAPAAAPVVPTPTEVPVAKEPTLDAPAPPQESVPVKPEAAPEKTEPQLPPTPKSTPEASTTPVTEEAPKIEAPAEAPKVEPSAPAPTETPKVQSQTSTALVEVPKTPTEAPKAEPIAPAPVEAPKEASKVEAPAVETPKVEAPAPVEAPKEAPVESAAPAPAEASKAAVEPPKEESKPAAPEAPKEAPKAEAAPAEAPKEASKAQSAAPTSPVPAVAPQATPEKAQSAITASTDSPPLATTPSKEDAPAVPAAKSEERRKPVGKLQLSVPLAGDPLATPDSEHEDAASLAQSIIASELRATVTSPSPVASPSPRPPLQEQRLSVEQPEVPTPPVSLEQIGVKPKGKPTTAALIESSIKTEAQTPPEPATPPTPTTPASPTGPAPSSEAPKKKVVKKVPKATTSGEAPVPPPRKKEKKPKEK